MRSVIKKALGGAIIFNKRRNYIKGIEDKNRFLKKSGLFMPFPIATVTPVISTYPFHHRSDGMWMDFFYSVNKESVDSFVPLSTYNLVIEPTLNRYPLLRGIKEKNFYNRLLKTVKTPATILRRMNHIFYDEDYHFVNLENDGIQSRLASVSEFLIKPSLRSGSGKSIMLFTRSGENHYSGSVMLDEVFLRNYGSDFIIQERVKLHPFFQKFSKECSNTLRVFTYRSVSDDKVHILHTLLRIGKKGSFLDHDNLGGVAIGINKEGFLNHHAIDIHGIKHQEFNGVLFKDIDRVPFLDQAHSVATKIAEEFFYGRLLAMDFIVNDEGENLLIEINCQGNGISQYQMNNGSLFKEFTTEILNFCKETIPHKLIFN